MISFIVCSIREDHLAGLAENLAASIGVPFELLVHRNGETRWGLARVYNHLAAQARHPLLCFLHEDVRFLSPPGWGRLLLDFYAARPDAGVVGFAGSQVKSRVPSGWSNLPRHNREHYVQHRGPDRKVPMRSNPHGEAFSRVVVVDGLCLFAPRRVWLENRFDEVTFPGFHLYDLDFCTRLAGRYQSFVCHTVLAEHFSAGSFGEDWKKASTDYHGKWAAQLPLSCVPLTADQKAQCETYSAYRTLRELLRQPAPDPSELSDAAATYRTHSRLGYDALLLRHRIRAAWRRLRSRSR
jgi:hypothetical protein